MTEPYFQDDTVTLWHGDCLDVLAGLPDASVDAVVTDPPYGLEFMGRKWDRDAGFLESLSATGRGSRVATERAGELTERGSGHSTSAGPYLAAGVDSVRVAGRPFQAWCEQWAAECLRVLKPGGMMLSFGGTRTWHRLACAIEDSGFEVRDSIAWLYGSGFPKSLDVSKAIDKRRDWSLVERLSDEIKRARSESGLSLAEVGQATLAATDGTYGKWYHRGGHMFFETGRSLPSRPEWDQLRHVLPVAPEFAEVYDEAEREVTGVHVEWENRTNYALTSADGLRRDKPATPDAERWQGWGTALKPAFEPIVVARKPLAGNTVANNVIEHGTGALNIDACRVGKGTSGRWPANVVLDESQAEVLDQQSGVSSSRIGKPRGADAGEGWGMTATGAEYGDSGGASRFFPTFRYEAKAPTSERPKVNGTAHPTVKPLDLMRWLVRLVTPPGGTVLEPFAGSGTTVEACIVEGFHCIAIEREAEYLPLIEQRIYRRRDPVAAIRLAGDDLGLFDTEKPA